MIVRSCWKGRVCAQSASGVMVMSAARRPRVKPGLVAKPDVPVMTGGSTGGLMRPAGRSTFSMGRPNRVASNTDFSWIPRMRGVFSRYVCLAPTRALPIDTGPEP